MRAVDEPDDHVEPRREKLLRQVVAMLHSVTRAILVHDGEVEPQLRICLRLLPLHAVHLERAMQTLVAHIPHAVQRQLALTLRHQDRMVHDRVDALNFPKVIEKRARVQEVHRAVGTGAGRIVVVAVDGEDGKSDIEIWVLVIHRFAAGVRRTASEHAVRKKSL
jgi:hypothetical protein